ncbi:MAG: RtcB family protein [Burkholderiales bacterium]|jgi:RNA-splicing ligase RtcB|nr:RtcB family protein [Burkholderiales bacterium]
MKQITGTHNLAICYTNNIEPAAVSQVETVCNRAEFADCKIRIMPDVHLGKGCTIGTTMTITDKIVPGMVGVDIGCGMETVKLEETQIDFKALDDLIRNKIPSGRNIRKELHAFNEKINLDELRCADKVNLTRARRSIGSLGGGNHFIEIDRSNAGHLYIVVHSGSRHLGTEVADYYQTEAYHSLCGNAQHQIDATIASLKAAGRDREIDATVKSLRSQTLHDYPKDLAYVSGSLFDDYIHDMKLTQYYAALNRQAMVNVIVSELNLTEIDRFTTIHNYIDTDSMILRKGAVSAKSGERLLIPINMRDGSLICVGKGNDDWNQSAPHGAGRLLSRSAAFKTLSMSQYKKEMECVFSTSVSRQTLDESPMAYKSMDEIIQHITPTAEILERVRPVYNFKASE